MGVAGKNGSIKSCDTILCRAIDVDNLPTMPADDIKLIDELLLGAAFARSSCSVSRASFAVGLRLRLNSARLKDAHWIPDLGTH